jgi:diguanylate cyclase (GGDEF)-like protein
LFDLDQLKQINDRYGHLTGNRALCRLADVLCVSCRDIDTAARFGGDEFALILPETGALPAKLVAQRICGTLAADGRDPKISVSVGAAIYPDDGQTIESILSAADLALYAMKAKRTTPGPSSGSSLQKSGGIRRKKPAGKKSASREKPMLTEKPIGGREKWPMAS